MMGAVVNYLTEAELVSVDIMPNLSSLLSPTLFDLIIFPLMLL
jgi:hypothetical protein